MMASTAGDPPRSIGKFACITVGSIAAHLVNFKLGAIGSEMDEKMGIAEFFFSHSFILTQRHWQASRLVHLEFRFANWCLAYCLNEAAMAATKSPTTYNTSRTMERARRKEL